MSWQRTLYKESSLDYNRMWAGFSFVFDVEKKEKKIIGITITEQVPRSGNNRMKLQLLLLPFSMRLRGARFDV